RPTPDDAVIVGRERADDRTRLALDLCMYAGLRVSEAAGLQAGDVMPDRLRITGKGGHQRFVPLNPALSLSLTAETERRHRAGVTSPWLFPSQNGGHLTPRHLGRLVAEALPDGWTAHTL